MAGMRFYAKKLKVSYPQIEDDSSMIGHWTAVLNADDTVPNLNNIGTLSGTPKTGVARVFNGSSTAIIGGAVSGIRAVSFNVKINTSTQYIVEFSTGIYIWVNAGNVELKGFAGGHSIYVNGVLTPAITTGTWTNVVVVLHTHLDATAVKFGNVGGLFFSGSASDFKLWRTALTSTEAALISGNTIDTTMSGLYPQDVLLWWPLFDSKLNSGYEFDHSGNGHMGTASGVHALSKFTPAPVFQHGFFGKSIVQVFDGANDYASSSSVLIDSAAADSGTIAAWVTMTTVQRAFVVGWKKGTAYALMLVESDGSVKCTVANSSGTTSVSTDAGVISAGKSYLLAFSFSGTNVKVYVNGADLSSGALSAGTVSTGFWIGSSNGSSKFFPGIISVAGVWSRSMNVRDVQSLVSGYQFEDVYSDWCEAVYYNEDNTAWTDIIGGNGDLTVYGTPSTYSTFALGKTGYLREKMTMRDNSYRALTTMQDGIIEIPHDSSLNITSEITIQFWMRIDKTGISQTAVSKQSAYLVQVDNTNKIRFYLYTPSANYLQSTTVLQQGVWYNIACTWDGNFMRIYINGQQDNLKSQIGTISTNTNPLIIGALSAASQRLYGAVGDLLLYDTNSELWKVNKNYRAGERLYLTS